MNLKSKIKTTIRGLLWGIGTLLVVCVGLRACDRDCRQHSVELAGQRTQLGYGSFVTIPLRVTQRLCNRIEPTTLQATSI